MKKIFLILLFLILLCAGTIQFVLLPKAKNYLETTLLSIGFETVEWEGVRPTFTGMSVDIIYLDKEKFNAAKNVRIKVFWPAYLFQSSFLKELTIEELTISSVANTATQALSTIKQITSHSIHPLVFEKTKIQRLLWDVATPQKALRFQGAVSLEKKGEDQEILANLQGQQHEINFNSVWNGVLYKDNSFFLDISVEDMNINTASFSLKRGSGWISYTNTSDNQDIHAQIDAGSGQIAYLPLQNINIILSQQTNTLPTIFRADIAGVENSGLFADITFSDKTEEQFANIVLQVNSAKSFTDILSIPDNQNQTTTSPTNLPQGETAFYITHENKKRFASGPYPLAFRLHNNQKDILTATVLIYPDSLDMRGTGQGNPESLSFIKNIIPLDGITSDGTVLRIESNAHSLLK